MLRATRAFLSGFCVMVVGVEKQPRVMAKADQEEQEHVLHTSGVLVGERGRIRTEPDC